jgi:Mitochondrial genome maintenance MGM101
MASQALLRSLKSARLPSYHGNPLFVTTRTYVTPVRTWARTVPIKTQKALASTGTGVADAGNHTSEEVKIPPTLANNGNASGYETGNGNGNGNGNGFGVELGLESQQEGTDWSKSYHGLSTQAFSKDIAEVLLAPIDPLDVEMKPGMYHLPSF